MSINAESGAARSREIPLVWVCAIISGMGFAALFVALTLNPEILREIYTLVFYGRASETVNSRFASSVYTVPIFWILLGFCIWDLARRGFVMEALQNRTMRNNAIQPNAKWLIVLFGIGMALIVQFVIGCSIGRRFVPPEYNFLCFLYKKEGTYEALTALIFIVCGLLVASKGITLFVRRDRNKSGGGLLPAIFVSIIAFALIFVGGEEISWGQTYLKWSTPEVLMEINTQQETNVHNIVTDVFPFLYPIKGLIFFIAIYVFTAFYMSRRNNSLLRVVLPSPNLIALAVCLPVACILPTEVPEIIAAVYVAFYTFALMKHKAV